MLIVAVAWIYVVALMAITEPSLVAGIMTLLIYCVLPLSILYYLTGSRRRRQARNKANQTTPSASSTSAVPDITPTKTATETPSDATADNSKISATPTHNALR